jgi:hypothetical protein
MSRYSISTPVRIRVLSWFFFKLVLPKGIALRFYLLEIFNGWGYVGS